MHWSALTHKRTNFFKILTSLARFQKKDLCALLKRGCLFSSPSCLIARGQLPLSLQKFPVLCVGNLGAVPFNLERLVRRVRRTAQVYDRKGKTPRPSAPRGCDNRRRCAPGEI